MEHRENGVHTDDIAEAIGMSSQPEHNIKKQSEATSSFPPAPMSERPRSRELNIGAAREGIKANPRRNIRQMSREEGD